MLTELHLFANVIDLIFVALCRLLVASHEQVGWMPCLPAAGAGRTATDSRSGVKADPTIISTFPGSPALWVGSFTYQTKESAERVNFFVIGNLSNRHAIQAILDQLLSL